MLKVGYDAQAFLSSNGGTGKGAQLRNLIGPYSQRFVGFASTGMNLSRLPLIQEGFAGYTLWQQFSLPASLRTHKIDVFLAPYNVAPFFLPKHVKLILVLHDTILLQNFRKHDIRGQLMDSYRRRQIPPSVARAHVVLTVSEHARREILHWFPAVDVRVIPCSIPEMWFDPRPLEGRAGFVLMVTSSAPHKNALGGLEGYAQYVRRAGPNARPLRVVGLSKQASSYRQQLVQDGIANLVTFLPFLSERELLAVYQQAGALLFPSLAEGFGIPMLEAMATGTPAIAARAASLPEVGGGAARYFEPSNPGSISEALHSVLSDRVLSEVMAERGLQQAQIYHPDIVRQQVISFWEEVAGIPADNILKTSSREQPIELTAR